MSFARHELERLVSQHSIHSRKKLLFRFFTQNERIINFLSCYSFCTISFVPWRFYGSFENGTQSHKSLPFWFMLCSALSNVLCLFFLPLLPHVFPGFIIIILFWTLSGNGFNKNMKTQIMNYVTPRICFCLYRFE